MQNDDFLIGKLCKVNTINSNEYIGERYFINIIHKNNFF